MRFVSKTMHCIQTLTYLSACTVLGRGRRGHHKQQVSYDGQRREEPMLKFSMLGISTSSHVIGLSMDLEIISNIPRRLKLERWR